MEMVGVVFVKSSLVLFFEGFEEDVALVCF